MLWLLILTFSVASSAAGEPPSDVKVAKSGRNHSELVGFDLVEDGGKGDIESFRKAREKVRMAEEKMLEDMHPERKSTTTPAPATTAAPPPAAVSQKPSVNKRWAKMSGDAQEALKNKLKNFHSTTGQNWRSHNGQSGSSTQSPGEMLDEMLKHTPPFFLPAMVMLSCISWLFCGYAQRYCCLPLARRFSMVWRSFFKNSTFTFTFRSVERDL